MTIVAIANALLDGVMRERFHAEPIVQATELLLQERVPREVPSLRPWEPEIKTPLRSAETDPSIGRKIVSPHQSIPSTLLLSNGRYAVMLTAAGSGYSRWGDIRRSRDGAKTRRVTTAAPISLLRDIRSGAVWSAPAIQPTCVEPDSYSAYCSTKTARSSRGVTAR